jgi:sugar phosphate isomerase/epimerase
MKLGIVTYQIAHDWDVPAIIQNCSNTGYKGVELRTTHAHGVEVGLSPEQRRDVKKQFEDAGLEIAGLGSAFEFHAMESAVVRKNIEGTIEYAKLASDLGCPGVKVRPNGLQEDQAIPVETTLKQIGLAVRECAQAAADLGIQIRVEVHGRGTSDPKHMRTIMDYADHSNAYVCWNCNPGEVVDGSVKESFDLLKDKIGLVHMGELHNPEYPWREFFALLKTRNYAGYMLAEIPLSPEPDRLLRYYKALWEAYAGS